MRVPFFDLRQQYQALSQEVEVAFREVCNASAFSGGPQVELFEKEFAAYCATSYCIGVNSGTSALHLALVACGVGPGDEVITTPLTFVATVAAIEYCGATPVLVDCAYETMTLDPELLSQRLTSRTKAIVPVHLHGRMAQIDQILRFGRDAGVAVVEDAAQAHGAVWSGQKAGTFGTVGCFSFYPSKNLGAYGEAGAVVTADQDLAQRVRMLRNWGATERDVHEVKGFNYRMEGIQAAVLRVKLPRLDTWNAARQTLALLYDEALSDLPLILPRTSSEGGHVYYVYTIRTPERDSLRKWLNDRGIGTHVHYPVPVHLQPAYRRVEYPPGSLPVSEQAAQELLSLPMFPEMSRDQLSLVCDEVRAFFRKN